MNKFFIYKLLLIAIFLCQIEPLLAGSLGTVFYTPQERTALQQMPAISTPPTPSAPASPPTAPTPSAPTPMASLPTLPIYFKGVMWLPSGPQLWINQRAYLPHQLPKNWVRYQAPYLIFYDEKQRIFVRLLPSQRILLPVFSPVLTLFEETTQTP